MGIQYIIAQTFGIIGLLLFAVSYQAKSNKNLFVYQAISGLSFALNFFLIGDVSAALFNTVNLIRGMIMSKSKKKPWEVISVIVLYTVCFVISMFIISGNLLNIFLSSVTFIGLVVMTYVMWRANPVHIRYTQLFLVSPAWLTNNIFHFTLGGILCEIFGITSVIISFVRYGKGGLKENNMR